MSEKFRHEVDTHARRHYYQKRRTKSVNAISFDQEKGYYNLDSSDLNLDYWFEKSDKVVSEEDPYPDRHGEEVMEDYSTDNWSSDDEETLQVHPETTPVSLLASGECWENCCGDACHNQGQLDMEDDDDDDIFTCDQMSVIREEETETFPLLYSVVLPYTGISRRIKGAGVGLNIHGGFSSANGLVAIITEVEETGPGCIIGNLTPGCTIHKWNGVSLLNKTHEQTREILSQTILSNELSLVVGNGNSRIEFSNILNVKKQSANSRRQSIISCSSQREWVFEENLSEERKHSLVEIKPNEQHFGSIQLSILCSRSQLKVTLHQGKLSTSAPVDPLASVTLIGEGLSNPDELLASQISICLSQTVNPIWNHKFGALKLPEESPSCTGLHLIIWDCKSDGQYKFIGEVFLNLSTASRSTAPTWYLLSSHDPNLPQLGTPEGVKKRATINKLFDRVLSTKRAAKPLQDTAHRSSLFKKLRGFANSRSEKSHRMLVMRPKVSVVSESTPAADYDSPNSCHQQLPPNGLSQQLFIENKQEEDSLYNGYSANGGSVEVEAVVEPHAYQPAWGIETELHKKPNPDLHGFEVRQDSPSSGYTSVRHSETSSMNRNSGFSNYSTSSTESPDVMWHGVDETGIKCPTMIRRSCSMNSFPVMDAKYQTIQEQYRKPSQASINSDQPVNDLPGLKPGQRSRSVEILMDTDSSTELSQTDSSQEEITSNQVRSDQRPENLIMSFKMKYSAVQQPSAPQKSRAFFIRAKKIKVPFRLFRSKHANDSSHANKSASSTSSIPSSPEGSKVCLTQQRKELGIGQFIPKLDHLQEPCGRIRFSLVQHRRLLLKIRTVEERSHTVSANECGIKATLVQGKEVICKKKVSTTLNSATNPLAEMYLDSRGCTDRMHLHIVITKGSRLSKKYVGEVWVNMKWADLSGLSSWYQLYT